MGRDAAAIRIQPRGWIRGPARIDKGWIILDQKRAQLYQPMESTNLVFDLASIRRPSDALEFCATYGLLWHGPDSDEYKEDFSAWVDAAGTLTGIIDIN